MQNYLIVAGYCVFACVVALAVTSFVRRFIFVAILSPAIAATTLQIIVYLYLGYFDAWGKIAFVTTWLIALVCTVAIYWLRRWWARSRASERLD
jgi:heme/copper-type cytochrome/quinol oxidase subunit 4